MVKNEKNIARILKFRKREPPLVTKARDISHSLLLQMWIFHLASNEVFDMFSKYRRFWAPSGLPRCLLLMWLGVIRDILVRVGKSASVYSGQDLQGESCRSLTGLIPSSLGWTYIICLHLKLK